MDLLGKTLLKGSMDKHLRKLSCAGESSSAAETSSSADTNEEQSEIQEMMNEKRNKMLREQAQRRAERAKAREEVRMRHNIKSSDVDKDYIENAPRQSLFDGMDGSEGPAQIASQLTSRVQTAWSQLTGRFGGD